MDRLKLLDAGLRAFDTTLPAVAPPLCVVTRYRGASCRLCLDVCPTAAITPTEWLAVEPERCTSCGACAAVCKTGALTFAERHDTLRERLRGPAAEGVRSVCLACRQVGAEPVPGAGAAGAGTAGAATKEELDAPFAGEPSATRVVVPCLGGLAAADLIAAAALGFATVELLCGDCAACADAAAGASVAATLTVAAEALDALGVHVACSRRSVPGPLSAAAPAMTAAGTAAAAAPESPAMSRAGLFSYLAQGLRRSAAAAGAPDKRGVAELHRQAPPPAARGRLLGDLALLRNEGSPPPSLPPELPLGEVTVSAACDGCGLCVRYCPHGSLVLAEGGLAVDRGSCSGCGLCAEVCPPAALAVGPASLPI